VAAEVLCMDARRCTAEAFEIPWDSSGTGCWNIFRSVPGASGKGRRVFADYIKD